jgi:succinoglycan biosynthesis protein ExoM
VTMVSVCIITYRRPEGLARLFAALDGLTFTKCPAAVMEVIVVDNDAQESAAAVCRDRSTGRYSLTYDVEPRRGIPQARNRAVQRASDLADFIAFVDDDEIPSSGWLDELLYVQRTWDADVIAGPVLPAFPETVPHWAVKGRFFDRARYPTGYPSPHVGAGNALVRARLFREKGLAFDERMALTGGEDVLLFSLISRLGYSIIWADEAVVYEWVPQSRLTPTWVLQRAYRLGNTWSLCERELNPSMATRLMRIAKGVGRIVQGVLLLAPSLLVGPHAVLNSVRWIVLGAGNLSGVAGFRYEEYRTTHGA